MENIKDELIKAKDAKTPLEDSLEKAIAEDEKAEAAELKKRKKRNKKKRCSDVEVLLLKVQMFRTT